MSDERGIRMQRGGALFPRGEGVSSSYTLTGQAVIGCQINAINHSAERPHIPLSSLIALIAHRSRGVIDGQQA